jgi:hypothetical protein
MGLDSYHEEREGDEAEATSQPSRSAGTATAGLGLLRQPQADSNVKEHAPGVRESSECLAFNRAECSRSWSACQSVYGVVQRLFTEILHPTGNWINRKVGTARNHRRFPWSLAVEPVKCITATNAVSPLMPRQFYTLRAQ